jgi:hypothetical protein
MVRPPGRSACGKEALSRATRRPRFARYALTWPRSTRLTLPRFAIGTSRARSGCASRRTRPNASRRSTSPGRRTLTRTPSRAWTLTPPALRRGRVVSSTRTRWSPGSAPRGGVTRTVTTAVAPARSDRRVGTTPSHVLAAVFPSAVRRVTSTTTRSVPSFRNLSVLALGPDRETLAGETDSCTRGGPASAADDVAASEEARAAASNNGGLNAR